MADIAIVSIVGSGPRYITDRKASTFSALLIDRNYLPVAGSTLLSVTFSKVLSGRKSPASIAGGRASRTTHS